MRELREEKKMYFKIMDDHFPDEIAITFGPSHQRLVYRKVTWRLPEGDKLIEKGLRYGENPGQEAAMYRLVAGNLQLGDCKFIEPSNGLVSAITEADMIQAGKHPGKTNLTDVDNALNILRYLTAKPACAIMKHNNPCGAALGKDIADAYRKANDADIVAAFGGAAVFNRPIDKITAEMISENYLEVVCAPEFEEGTVGILKQRKNLRIIRMDRIDRLNEYETKVFVDFKSMLDGGLIVQQSLLNQVRSAEHLKRAQHTHKGMDYKINRWPPTEQEISDMLFGWAVECGVSSNSVLFVKSGATVSIGTGQQDRVDVTIMARDKAYRKLADRICRQELGIPYNSLELLIDHKLRGVVTDYEEKNVSEVAKQGHTMLAYNRDEILAKVNRQYGGLTGAVAVSDAFFPERDGVDVALREGVTAIVQPGGSDKDYKSIQACNERNATMAFTNQRVFKH